MEELYHQITLDEWIGMKEDLHRELLGVSQSFIRIGYKLRRIKDQELFRNDGCETITEWGQKELGLNATAVSRCMHINEKYSVDGYSEELLPEYQGFGYGKLGEMLTLPAEDMAMVRPEMSKKDIQELKRFNKETPGEENDILDLVRDFWEKNMDLLKELDFDDDVEDLADQINPSGNRAHKKGRYFMFLYENDIKVKCYGEAPETMTWERFIEITKEIVGEISKEEPESTAEAQEEAGEPVPAENQEETATERPFAPAQMTDSTDKTPDEEVPEIDEDFMPKPEPVEEKTEQNGQEDGQNDQEADQIDAEKPEETPDETETETENEAAAAVEAEIVEEEEAETAESTENTDQMTLGGITDMIMDLRRSVWNQMWDDALELTEKINKAIREVQECL